jgi:hypothetical protein
VGELAKMGEERQALSTFDAACAAVHAIDARYMAGESGPELDAALSAAWDARNAADAVCVGLGMWR